MNAVGVYAIVNLANGKFYIGSTRRSFSHRWAAHVATLIGGCHSNIHLQAAWREYGEGNFAFLVLEETLANSALGREQFWLDVAFATQKPRLYNVARNATCGWAGIAKTPEWKAHMSSIMKARRGTEDEKRRQSEVTKTYFSDPHSRERLRAVLAEYYQSEQGKAMAAERQRRKWLDPAFRERTGRAISAAGQGKTNRATTHHGLVSPEGVPYPSIHNLAAFCREYGLSASRCTLVMQGKARSNRGWTAFV